jgi:hypothetical protein
MSLAET